jgi:hypothetical protein
MVVLARTSQNAIKITSSVSPRILKPILKAEEFRPQKINAFNLTISSSLSFAATSHKVEGKRTVSVLDPCREFMTKESS